MKISMLMEGLVVVALVGVNASVAPAQGQSAGRSAGTQSLRPLRAGVTTTGGVNG